MVNITTVLLGCMLVLTQQTQFLNGANTVKVESGIFGEVQEDQVGKENIPQNKTNLKLLLEAKDFQQIKSEYFKRGVVTAESPEHMYDVKFGPKIRTDGYIKSSPEDNPYAVDLSITYHPSGNSSICSGSLLTVEWVLTAAHCMFKSGETVDETWITAGGSKANGTSLENPHAQELLAEKLIPFPSYDPQIKSSGRFDIMLVKAKGKFRLTKYVGTIALSTSLWDKGSKKCVVVGFGSVLFKKEHADDFTRKTHQLKVNSPCACSSLIDPFGSYVTAEPKEDYGVCTGDSGSGLVCDGKIQAVSKEITRLNPESCKFELEVDCGSAKTSQVFLKTCPFLSWISEHVDVVSKSQIPKACLSFFSNGSLVQYSSVFVMLLSQIFVILLLI